jgi:hypothetical protein
MDQKSETPHATDTEVDWFKFCEYLVTRYRAGYFPEDIMDDMENLSEFWDRCGYTCRVPNHYSRREFLKKMSDESEAWWESRLVNARRCPKSKPR